MFRKWLSLVTYTLLLTLSAYGQAPPQDETWVYLYGGQSAFGVEYRQDGAVHLGGSLLMRCSDMGAAGYVFVSKPSGRRGLSLVKCAYDSEARIVDTKSQKALSKNLLREGNALGSWASWSPDERYLVAVRGGEGIKTTFFVVDLATLRPREISPKIPTTDAETDDFQGENFVWLGNSVFRVRIDVTCNPFTSDRCTEQSRGTVLRSYDARVNVATASATVAVPGGSASRAPLRTPPGRRPAPREFTVDRECDGGQCHFDTITFRYGRGFSIAVGVGDTSLSYYFSVEVQKGGVLKDYIYSDEGGEYFAEKGSGRRVDPELNALLLDVYRLGMDLINNNVDVMGRRFSESGKYAVLASLRAYFRG